MKLCKYFYYLLFGLLIFSASCTPKEDVLFTLLTSTQTNIEFENKVESTIDFNILNYLYFYDGGGVAVGDINNNGLPDIFFVGNDVENKLYLNKGDFKFEDITETAGVAGEAGAWSKGVTMADVNGNGYLDIYVSRVNFLTKEGANQLFINNGDLTFTEKAKEYGLDFKGYSTQAAFFDYNKSGRLDLFLLNHSFHSEKTLDQGVANRQIDDPKAGDRLFRNDGNRFTEVSYEAGIYTSPLGYGLGVAISDINKNGWPDIYVGNDFLEDDYLYINQGDGTFVEALYSSFGHTSGSSMGNDIADITNNGHVDVISLDMMPEDHEIYMRSGGPSVQYIYDRKLELGFGHKNARNTLQINRGKNPKGTSVFSEVAFLSGVAKTDWSWASLFMDLNNNGWKDLLITNGMVRRPNDMDYISWSRRSGELSDYEFFKQALDVMPELKIPNYVFQNYGDLKFSNMTNDWGFDQPSFSSGAAYADLNNNGRLDLIISNLNMPPFIYKNNTPLDDKTANYLKIRLIGDTQNTTGIGSKVILYKNDELFYQEQMPTRGFQSSVDHVIHFGLGEINKLDSLLVIWPDDRYEIIIDIDANQLLELKQLNAFDSFEYKKLDRECTDVLLTDVSDKFEINFQHRENSFNDYTNEPLIPYKLSTQGPAMAVGDVNGNGLDDVFIGGASGQLSSLFIQQYDGSFIEVHQEIFEKDKMSEDVDAVFFDATGDGFLDLYVVSGGGQFTGNDPKLKDRLYINMGKGQFVKSDNRLPNLFVNGSIVRPIDYNNNGHIDLFVGGRSIPFQYGLSPLSVLLKNDGSGFFQNITNEVAPDLINAGMTTDAQWVFISNKEFPDLVVTAEWMPIQYFQNNEGNLVNITDQVGLGGTNGLWQSLLIEDITGDGNMDIFAGNFGLNSRIHATKESPFRLYINDFNNNGLVSAVMAQQVNGEYYPFDQLDELVVEHRELVGRLESYEDFSTRTMENLFGEEKISSSIIRELTDLKTSLFVNNGDGTFSKGRLPIKVQFSPVMVMYALDNTESKGIDLVIGGNIFDVRPSVGGRQDASYGLYLQWKELGEFKPIEIQCSGIYLAGEARKIEKISTVNGEKIIIAQNDLGLLVFKTFD